MPSVTRLMDYLHNIWPFTAKKICPITKNAKVGSKFGQIQNEHHKIALECIILAKVAKLRPIWSHLIWRAAFREVKVLADSDKYKMALCNCQNER